MVDHLVQQAFATIRDAMMAQSQVPADTGSTLLSVIQSILEADLPFYRKILSSNASSIMSEELTSVVLDFMLEHKDRFYPGSQEEYQIVIRFCAGGLSNLYHDWFSGKISCSLGELTRMGDLLIRRMIGENSN